MVARPGVYQASFNAGELAPAVWGRSDIKQFYAGASAMVNAEPVPQGGFDGLPGTVDTGPVRGPLSLRSGALTFSPGPHALPAVIAQLALAQPAMVGCIDVSGLAASVALTDLIVAEVSPDGVFWQAMGPPLSAGPTARTRRRAAPPGAPVPALFVRLRLIAVPPSPVTFTLAGLSCQHEELAEPLAARMVAFSFSTTEAFTATLVPGSCDLHLGDQFVGSAALWLSAEQLAAIKFEQRLNTLLIFHPDLAPIRVMRLAGDWQTDNAPFVNLPNVNYGETYGNVVNDVWNITLRWSGSPVDLALELTVNGEDTQAVTLASGPNWTGFLTALKAAIEALPSVEPGVTVTQPELLTLSSVIRVEFSGAGNAGQRFTMAARINNVTTAAASVSHPQFGDPGGEAIMSPLRGWPVTGKFYQDRLFLAGFRSEPGGLLGSVTGEYFDLNTRVESASGGVLARTDTDGAERIEHLARARHLVIFTDQGEYYVSDRAIVRTTPPNVATSSRNGCAPRIRPVENEGDLIYVGGSRAVLYACAFDDVKQAYVSDPISLLATHLCAGFTAMALQKASESTDASRLFLVREDGLLVTGVMIRNQEVTAFVRWITDGLTRDACVDGANRAFLLVSRPVGGARRMFRERLDPLADLHQCRTFTFTTPTQIITGLDAYEGRTVWARADGYYDRPYTVSQGQITLAEPATEVQVGRWTAPLVRTLPAPRLVGERVQLARPVRAHTVRARLAGATSIAIAANGRPARDVPLVRAGDPSSQPVQPVERAIQVTGLAGYSEEGFVTFTQLRPGRFAVRDVTIEMRS